MKITQGLRDEILKTLLFFADTDINVRGYISSDTIECFNVQKVELPKEYHKFIKK